MYKRILLAYDGSREGRTALREGALLARRYGAQVFLQSVISQAAGAQLGEGVGGDGAVQQQELYKSVLRDGLGRLKRLGFEAVGKLVIGEPAREIGAFAAEIGADLVIVGHQRQSAFGRWWSGPSGAYLIDHIPCSLLVCQNVLSDEAFESAMLEAAHSAAVASAAADSSDGAGTDAGAGAGAAADGGVGSSSSPAAGSAGAGPPAATTAARDPGSAPLPPSRRRLRRALFLLLPLVLIVALIIYVSGGRMVSTDDAYVEAQTVGISTDVSGIVRSVAVYDNQRVQNGQVLYVLDDQPFRYALQRAVAQVGNVRDQLHALQANYRELSAQINQAQYDVTYNSTQFQRARNLLGVNFVSKSAYDAVHRNLQSAQQKLDSLQQQQQAIAANLDGDPEGPVERNPRYLAAVAQRDEAARKLAHTTVRAPFAGIVTSVPSIAPGRYLAASTTAFYLVDTNHVWVDAEPKETQLTNVRPGQPATLRVDTYPDDRWYGRVASISPAAAQQFALLPAQNTSGNWVKVVQRIPMRILVNTPADLPPLRAGMSVEVSVDIGRTRGSRLLNRWFGRPAQRR